MILHLTNEQVLVIVKGLRALNDNIANEVATGTLEQAMKAAITFRTMVEVQDKIEHEMATL